VKAGQYHNLQPEITLQQKSEEDGQSISYITFLFKHSGDRTQTIASSLRHSLDVKLRGKEGSCIEISDDAKVQNRAADPIPHSGSVHREFAISTRCHIDKLSIDR